MTASSNDPFSEFPKEVQNALRQVWNRVPVERQAQLRTLLPSLPVTNLDGMRKLYELGQQHFDMAFGDFHEVAIVGPTNVGKSTLYNQLIRSTQDAAEVSAVPGTTRYNRRADAGLFQIIDTPGVDNIADRGGKEERQRALEAARSADMIVLMFDAIQGIKADEKALYDEMVQLNKPIVVVLNKIDLIGRRDTRAVVEQAANNLNLPVTEIIPISAQKKRALEAVLLAIAKSEPRLLAALGAALPQYRGRLAWQAILRAATSSAIVALTPIPIIDFIPLAGIQGLLVLSIARIYQYKITPARAAELAGSLGVGYIGRAVFYELTKLGGPPTWVISVAVAASMTVVVGYASILWFAYGERLTGPKMRQLTRRITQYLIQRLTGLGRRRPGRQTLSETLSDALEASEFSEMAQSVPTSETP